MKKTISPVSMFSLHIEMMRNNKPIGDGTGFIYFHEPSKLHFLVTNYHVLTARNPRDPSMLLPGFPDSPDELCWFMLDRTPEGSLAWRRGSTKLTTNDFEWIEHENRVDGIDLIALPLNLPSSTRIYSQDKLGLVDDIDVGIGDDLFIVGYPFGIGIEGVLPIWKRGTVASEPLISPNGLPQFYIDAATMPGMSGAPVFAMEPRDMVVMDRKGKEAYDNLIKGKGDFNENFMNLDANAMMKSTRERCLKLVGVYSGRLLNGEKDPGIGIVWSTAALEAMFKTPRVTKHPFPPN